MSGNRLEKQNFVEKQQLTTAGEQIVHEEILDDLQQNETDLVVTTTEKNTGKLQVDVLNNPIKIVKQSMSDPTESLPAGITLGEMKDASGTVTHLAFIDATGSAQGNSVIDVEQLNNEIAASGSPIIKEFTLGGQIYRCSYTISSETLSVSIDMIDAFEQLPVKIGSGPVIPNAKNFETAKPNTQEYWLVHNGTIAYPSALYQRITKANQVGKRVPQQRADMISLGVTKAELASSAPVEKIGTVTLPDTGEIRRYKAIYTVVDGKLTVTLTEASIELQPNEVILQHIPQIRNGIDETQLTVGLDQAKQLLTIDYAGKSTTLDLKNYPTWNTYGTITTLQPTDLPKIPMADGRILRLGVTLERTVDGKLNIRTRETPVAHETIQFADSVGNPTQTPMGKTLRRLKTDGAGMYREITDTSRYGGVLARLPVASEDFDHTPGTIRSLHTSPLFINGKTYEPVLGVDAGGTHLLQLRHIEGARGLIKGVNPFIQYGGGEPQAGAREIQAISEGSISKWTPDDPKNRAALDTFFMTNDRTITVQYRSPDGTLVPITLEYGFDDLYNKGIVEKNSVFRQKTVTIDGKQLDLQFRLAIHNGNLQMTVDNVTKSESIKVPEILQDPKDAYTNFLREELVYGKTTVKGYFNQLNGPASLTADRETKFKKLYPSQQNVAGIPFDNSKITIFRTDEFKPLNVENPLELGDDDSLFSFDLDTIPADKRNRMKPVINPDGSRNGGEKHTFYPKVADRGTLGFRPPLYNNETRPTEITLEPIWGTPEIVEDDKGDFDPRNDVKVAKRPLLGYATRIKVLIPENSKYREADREIDRDYIQQKAKEAGKTVGELLTELGILVGGVVVGIGEGIKNMIPEERKDALDSILAKIKRKKRGKETNEVSSSFLDRNECLGLGLTSPMKGGQLHFKESGRADYTIDRNFGPCQKSIRASGYHEGIDLNTIDDKEGQGNYPVQAVGPGKVILSNGKDLKILLDKTKKVQIGGESYRIIVTYHHLDPKNPGKQAPVGKSVNGGDDIGVLDPNYSGGAHLHLGYSLVKTSEVDDNNPTEAREKVQKFNYPWKSGSAYVDPQFFHEDAGGAKFKISSENIPQGYLHHKNAKSEKLDQAETKAIQQAYDDYVGSGLNLNSNPLTNQDFFAISGVETGFGENTVGSGVAAGAYGHFQIQKGPLVADFKQRESYYPVDFMRRHGIANIADMEDEKSEIYTDVSKNAYLALAVLHVKQKDIKNKKMYEWEDTYGGDSAIIDKAIQMAKPSGIADSDEEYKILVEYVIAKLKAGEGDRKERFELQGAYNGEHPDTDKKFWWKAHALAVLAVSAALADGATSVGSDDDEHEEKKTKLSEIKETVPPAGHMVKMKIFRDEITIAEPQKSKLYEQVKEGGETYGVLKESIQIKKVNPEIKDLAKLAKNNFHMYSEFDQKYWFAVEKVGSERKYIIKDTTNSSTVADISWFITDAFKKSRLFHGGGSKPGVYNLNSCISKSFEQDIGGKKYTCRLALKGPVGTTAQDGESSLQLCVSPK